MTGLYFITPFYAGFFGILLVALSWRVAQLRQKYEGRMGEAGHTALTAAIRAQSNIVEYLPMALLLMWMLEGMGSSHALLHVLGGFIVFARLLLLHGLNDPSGNGPGRKLGTRLTWAHIVVCGLLAFAGVFRIVL